MKYVFFLFVHISISLAPSDVFAQPNGIFGIYSSTTKGSQGGTAFLVSRSGDLVTAYHVVEGATSISIQDAHKGVIDSTGALVRAIDPKRDLAIIVVPALANRKALELKARFPSPKESLRVIGYPRGMPNAVVSARTLRDGAVTSANSPFRVSQGPLLVGDVEVIPLDMTIYGGLSGSPLIDSNDLVVGLVSGSLNEGGAFAWAIPAENISKLLDNSQRPLPIASFSWPRLELLAPYAKTTARSYAGTTDSFALRVKYREALAKYLRSTELLRSQIAIAGSIHGRACSSLRISGDTASQFNLSSIDMQSGLLSFELNNTRNVAEQYRSALLTRIESSKIIRSYLREIADLPSRADLPPKRADDLSKLLQRLQLAEPELYRSNYEDVSGLRSDSASNWIASLNSIQGKQQLLVSDALVVSDRCSAMFNDIKRFERFTNTPDDRQIETEVKLYTAYASLVDHFADFIAFK